MMSTGVLVGLLAVGSTACGSGSDEPVGRVPTPSTADEHRTQLAEGETPGIASQLTAVPGYHYVDVGADEVEGALALSRAFEESAGRPGFFRALSLHSVVADDSAANITQNGREVGFLQLREFDPAPALGSDEQILKIAVGSVGEFRESYTVGTTTVYIHEDPTSSASRYHLSWLRHGVLGSIDGADRAALAQWVDAYLAIPEREPAENTLLAERLRPVPGFVYTNWWESSTRDLIGRIFPESAVTSAHAVGTAEGTVGGLMLAECADDTVESVADRVETEVGVTTEARRIGSADVRFGFAEGANYYVWTDDGVCGVFTGSITAADERFMASYLSR